MNIESRKRDFSAEFEKLTNEEVLSQLEKLLRKANHLEALQLRVDQSGQEL